jgi:TPR repeat protein
VPKNVAEAVKYLRFSARQGLLRARTALGTLYVKGEGVAKDPTRGLMWIISAADEGEREAQKVVKETLEKIPPDVMASVRKMLADCEAKKFEGCD